MELTLTLVIICNNHLDYDLPCRFQLQEFSTHPGLLLVPKMSPDPLRTPTPSLPPRALI